MKDVLRKLSFGPDIPDRLLIAIAEVLVLERRHLWPDHWEALQLLVGAYFTHGDMVVDIRGRLQEINQTDLLFDQLKTLAEEVIAWNSQFEHDNRPTYTDPAF
jgi:hypothetical protein